MNTRLSDPLFPLLKLGLCLAACGCLAAASAYGDATSFFNKHLGLQLYSLRDTMKKDVPKALDQAKAWGMTEVEFGANDAKGMTDEEFVAAIKERGLKAVGAHFTYEWLQQDIDKCVRRAQALGVRYAICTAIPHPDLTEAQTHAAASAFNKWGAAFAAAGIRFAYHTHGHEFHPSSAGNGDTDFDVLMRETDPKLVCVEMDVFWVAHAGQDPIQLFNKYPDRFALMHLKDLRKGRRPGRCSSSARRPRILSRSAAARSTGRTSCRSR